MSGSLPLGRVLGVPLRLHYSWFVVFLLVTASLATRYFPDVLPHSSALADWALATAASLLLFASVLGHELTHSLVAMREGHSVRGITLFLFGGIAEIEEEARQPVSEFKIALAGPAASLALAGAFGLTTLQGSWLGGMVSAVSAWLTTINLSLAAFNMLPGYPLDGGRLLRSLLWWRSGDYYAASQKAAQVGRGMAFLLILIGLGIALSGNVLGGLWLGLIGWFLEGAAQNYQRQLSQNKALRRLKAAEVMTGGCLPISASQTVRELIEGYVLSQGCRCFLVSKNGGLQGILTLEGIRQVPSSLWDVTAASQAMTPIDKVREVEPEEEATTVLALMEREGLEQVAVVQGGLFLGIVHRDRLLGLGGKLEV